MLLCVWLYGFMTGVRSCRKLEAACRDQIPYLWLTGWQHPDHNTLWRFYKGHRQAMKELFKRTVRTAVAMKLVDLAVQAVDGTRVAANAANKRSYDAEGLRRLLERVERAIADLEAQNEAGEDAPAVHLPGGLADKEELREQVREQVRQAKDDLAGQERPGRINLTDKDARMMKGRQGLIAGYNTQAMVSPLALDGQATGMLITAVDVVDEAHDRARLIPMPEQAGETTGVKAPMTLADAGYHSGPNLEECAGRGQTVAMPESTQRWSREYPYHKDRFTYDEARDSFTCPQGQTLPYVGTRHTGGVPYRFYQAPGAVCRACPAFGVCIKSARKGRSLSIEPRDVILRRHRAWMATDEVREVYRRRQQLVEPVFGVVKDQQRGAFVMPDRMN